jgi:predicted MFS family arabinose efflux permease
LSSFSALLRSNRNYRYAWTGQVVSEIGDHFNNIAVFSLVMQTTGSGLIVSGVMLARAVPAIVAGPVAGVVLDRLDRRQVMIASDLIRAVVALGFVATVHAPRTWLLFVLSGLLMFASPFFTSGRAAILPRIASPDELHTANALTQTTQWTTLTVGTMAAGISAATLGFTAAFVLNSLSFLFSAWAISRLRASQPGFRAPVTTLTGAPVARPWHEYVEGLRYMRRQPLILAVALLGIGWASGGGAAQILFTLFGEVVFDRGPAGIGILWGCAGVGLIIGGTLAHWLGPRIGFGSYKRLVAACYLVHGAAYVIFSQMESFGWALVFIGLSRAAVAVSSVLNTTLLLRHVADSYRGRVFSTNESLVWATMMLSMLAAGLASQRVSPRTIGAWSGVLSSLTAVYWLWADRFGLLVEPTPAGIDPHDVEVRQEPPV